MARMSEPALVVIDVQRGFDDPAWGPRNNPACEQRVADLVAAWHQRRMPIVLVRHDSTKPGSPLSPGQPGNELKPELDGVDADMLVTAYHGCKAPEVVVADRRAVVWARSVPLQDLGAQIPGYGNLRAQTSEWEKSRPDKGSKLARRPTRARFRAKPM